MDGNNRLMFHNYSHAIAIITISYFCEQIIIIVLSCQ